MANMVSTREAAQIVSVLLATPFQQRAEQWPSLLTLLARWAAQAGVITAPKRPLKPWELKQQQQQPQQQQQQQQESKQKLLQQAAAAVQCALQETAQQALCDAQGPAGSLLARLFVPAVLFVSAALPVVGASAGPQGQELQHAVVAATWEAAAALTAAPAAALLAAGGQQQGLPAVVSSCKALLLACMGVPSQAAWLVSSLLAALHAAVPDMLQHMQQVQQQQLSHKQQGGSRAMQPWLLEQGQESAACSMLALLGGLYQLGHDLGASCCRAAPPAAAAAAGPHHSPQLPTTGGAAAASSSSLQTVSEIAAALAAACSEGCDLLLQGLAASVSAGCSSGLLLSLAHNATASATQQQQQLLQQATALLAAVQAAAGSCCHDSPNSQPLSTGLASPAAAAAAAGAVGRGLLGQACARLLSTCGHLPPALNSASAAGSPQQQQQLLVQPGLSSLLLTLQYLTPHCCSLSGVFVQAAGSHNAAAANAWLKAQQHQHPAQEVGVLSRWLAGAAAALPGGELLQLLAAVSTAGVQLARSFSSYQLLVPAGVAAGVDAALVRQQLDRTFAMHVVLLADIWAAVQELSAKQQQQQHAVLGAAVAPDAKQGGIAASEEGFRSLRAAVVAVGLQDLSSLQFCRVQLPAYMELLRGLVAALASEEDSCAADAFIAASLPCYERLVQTHPAADAAQVSTSSRGMTSTCPGNSSSSSVAGWASAEQPLGSAAAVWLKDTVTAAELSFLLPLLPVAVRAASQPAVAAARVLPLVLLLLPHPLPAVAQAAHASFAALLAVAAEMQLKQPSQHQQTRHAAATTGAVDTAISIDPQQQPQQQMMEVVQQAVPMYIQRTLSGLPSYGSLEGFSSSFYSLIKNTPCGSTMPLLAVARMAERAVQLATDAAAASAAAAATTDSAVEGWASAEACPDSAWPSSDFSSEWPQQQQQQQQRKPIAGAGGALAADGGEVGSGSVGDAAGAAQEPAAAAGAAANKLFELLVLAVQAGDYQLLPAVLQKVAGCVLATPEAHQQQWLAQLYAGCLAVGDYTRKPALLEWFNSLQAQLLQQVRAQRGKRSHQAPSSGCVEQSVV